MAAPWHEEGWGPVARRLTRAGVPGGAMSSWDARRRSSQPGLSSRLRMDSYSGAGRASRSRAVSPKRRELDNVMKKARRDGPTQSSYWNKKLLEAEEKDPNRWRHSGFKELYGGGGASSPVGSRSSYRRSRSRSRSRPPRRSRSRARSPVAAPRPRSRERARERERERRPHTPQPQAQKVQSPPRGGRPLARRSSRIASLSGSSRSLSSCSDESCSVCSPKTNKKVVPNPKYRSRSRSFSVPRNQPTNRSPLSPRADARRLREKSSPPRDPRRPPTSPPPAARNKVKVKRKTSRDKGAGASLKKRKSRRKRRRPAPPEGSVLRRASPLPSASEDSSTSSVTSGGGATRLTLSERFGKMAQWSVDRRDLDGVKNMRITKQADSSDLKVVIEGDRYRSPSPAPASDRRIGLGYYPETLHSAPVGLDAWDDVRVRYKYYKDRGYLRDLSLDDYVKWEEWWYKYQDWLEAERYYEHWAALHAEEATRSSRRRRLRR
ncbi:serine/arginine repetitive matrix protein 2 isoform X2 [Bacillus rossius redtenbacheri]|uniref:serine/arginine repetitive matrix protein 2 isoform X2 n=1 Tax=Bacillus rossius redtenbacheri TaxID=93214 RepID=UPI002FDE9B79